MKEERTAVDFSGENPKFSYERRGEYTILVPDMLPWHFELLIYAAAKRGYRMEMLQNHGRQVIDEGLKHVHNDTCFPALCIVGQFLDALKSGKYDPERTAVLITQSGGGCRASNYVPLIRKALKAEFPQVPVLSLNVAGLERENGFPVGVSFLLDIAYGVFYGDLIMICYNQTAPYERNAGDAAAARERCMAALKERIDRGRLRKLKRNAKFVLETFAAVPVSAEKKIRVGIVGEIYVKYSPLGNSDLEKFLLSEGCEPVVPALTDFFLYCLINNVNDARLYGTHRMRALVSRIAYNFLRRRQDRMISLFKKQGRFEPPHPFKRLRKLADKVLNQGVKMGEGWLIPAEMAALCETGVENIVCTQPFGCLPNHIAGKGAVRSVKALFPDANIVPVDYDPSATRVNQENRIKLMLAQAREKQ